MWPPLQVGYRIKKTEALTKPEMGHLEKNNAPPMRHLREFKVSQQPVAS